MGGRREPFSGDELELLRTICDMIASALDRGRLRYQLHTEHARFQSLLDHIPAAVLLAEASGRIVMGNPQAERMLGQPVPSPATAPVGPPSCRWCKPCPARSRRPSTICCTATTARRPGCTPTARRFATRRDT